MAEKISLTTEVKSINKNLAINTGLHENDSLNEFLSGVFTC